MKRLLLLASFLLLASAIPVHATGITDPGIGMDDPPCIEGCPVPGFTPISGAMGSSFTFNANGGGGGISFFQTASDINFMDIETIDPAITSSSQVNCYSNVFVCAVTILDGVTDIYFNHICGELGCTSIPAGNEFDINLNDAVCNPFTATCDRNGSGGWIANELFTAFPNTDKPTMPLISTPEPSTISLLVMGMLGMLGLLVVKNKKMLGHHRSGAL